MATERLTHRDYTVGWVCALPQELAAATVMLSSRHPDLPNSSGDKNTYTLGSIHGHNIAIACLPAGDIGTNPAATVASRMPSTFPSLRFWLMVGIGGGVPPKVRLGDVVVSTPVYDTPGLIQWDLGIAQENKVFRRIGALDKAPEALRTAITKLRAQHEIVGQDIHLLSILEEIRSKQPIFASQYLQTEGLEDVLFQAVYGHQSQGVPIKNDKDQDEDSNNDNGDGTGEEDGTSNCRYCDRAKVIKRRPRTTKTKIHYGLITSGNQVIKDAIQRDEINQMLGGNLLCFEMEAAGITTGHPCLVIRGICDYSDSHKNYSWQRYAAVVAAAFAQELLGFVASDQINAMPPAAEVLDGLKDVRHLVAQNLKATHKIDMDFILSRLPSVDGAAFNPFSNQLEPICHPETRIDLLREIDRWVLDPRSKCIFWLNGMAGTGKSTISRTVARDFANRHQLGASFFFKGGERDCGNASRFFTTIATQLVQNLPDLKVHLQKAMKVDPAISTKTMKEQFEKLILGPLSALELPLQTLIVIDALDECENYDHVTIILHLLARIQSIKSVKLRLLVTSRPELPIRIGFQRIPESHRNFILHEIPPPIIEHDIGIFLKDEFPKIRDAYNCLPPSGVIIPSNWPTERTLRALVNMAVPLFIFAATVCRFIGETSDWNPVGKLINVLHYQSIGSLTQLEKTYLPVLNQMLPGNLTRLEKENRVREFRDIVGSIVILFEPLSRSCLALLLGIPRSTIDRKLHTLHSVLGVPTDPELPVRPFHLSFHDFLVDSERKQSDFWIDEDETQKKIGFRCLDLLSKTPCLKKDICSLRKPGYLRTDIDGHLIEKCLPTEVQYACRYWASHLEKGNCSISDQDRVHSFLKQRFFHWVEALSIMGKVQDSISMIASLQNILNFDNSLILGAFLNDATHFLLKNRNVLNLAPLQLYSSAIIFAPSTSIIKNQFKEHLPSWLRKLPKVPKAWDSILQTFEGHSGSVSSVAFSPNSKMLASGSRDRTIRLWNPRMGDIQQILEGHLGPIFSVAFSPDGKLLASGSMDKTIKLWDPITGDVQRTLQGHSDVIRSVAFLPHGHMLASGSDDKTVKLWDLTTGHIQQTLRGNSAAVCSIAFSPNGELLAIGSRDRKIQLWDLLVGNSRLALEGHSERIQSIAFSPDGKLLASGSNDRSIKIWDLITNNPHQTLKGHSDSVSSITFSSNGRLLASSSHDETVKLWDLVTGDLKQTLRSHSRSILSLAFSPDDKLLASSSTDKTIATWDPTIIEVQQADFEDHSEKIFSVAFSSDGKLVASGSDKKNIRIWDPIAGDTIKILRSDLAEITFVSFSQDNDLLTARSEHGVVELWDLFTSEKRRTFGTHSDSIRALTFSPDGKLLAFGYDKENTIKLWDLSIDDVKQTLRGCSDSFQSTGEGSLTEANAHQTIEDHLVTTYHIEYKVSKNVNNLQEAFEGHSDHIYSLAFSSDAKILASGSADQTIKLWDLAMGKVTQTLTGHSAAVTSLAFSADSKLLASYSDDETVKLWNVVSGNLKQTIEICLGSFPRLSLHADAQRLETQKGTIRIRHNQGDDLPVQPHKGLIFLNTDWITWNGENMIWLPRTYRWRQSDHKGNQLALGYASGSVVFFEIDFALG